MARPRGGEWLPDEIAALLEAEADVLVSMLTASELRELDLTEETAAAGAAGIRFIGLPTPTGAPRNWSPSGLWCPSPSTS